MIDLTDLYYPKGDGMQYVTANARFSNADPIRSEMIIRNWNTIVGKADIVFHLGLFALENPLSFLRRLNGLVVAVVGEEQLPFEGLKFKKLYLCTDGTFHRDRPSNRDGVICILQVGEENVTDSAYPEILAVNSGSWRALGCGQRIVGHNFFKPLLKPVVNANTDLWGLMPVPLIEIVNRYFGYWGLLPQFSSRLQLVWPNNRFFPGRQEWRTIC